MYLTVLFIVLHNAGNYNVSNQFLLILDILVKPLIPLRRSNKKACTSEK